MYARWNLFKDYCSKNNIQLLKDDLKFIERELQKIPLNEHRAILRVYTDKWLHEVKKNEKSYQNQNFARKQANKWLFEYCNSGDRRPPIESVID